MGYVRHVEITAALHAAVIDHAIAEIPYEGCGVLVGMPGVERIDAWISCNNAAESAKTYEIDPRDLLMAHKNAEATGNEIVGVVHSHTHTPAYPSPTDVALAHDPTWIYLVISLENPEAVVASFSIVDGSIYQDDLVVTSH